MAQLREKRLFLLDMDGTIYLDEQLFDGVPEFLRYVRRIGGRYLFLTNNSSRGVEGYIEKMHRLGIDTCREDYLTSVDATIRYLRVSLPGRICYVAGTVSFMDQLAQAGIPVTRDREQAEVLLCGFDTELTFQKLEDACILLNPGRPLHRHQSGLGLPYMVRLRAGLRQRVPDAHHRHRAGAYLHRQAPAGDGEAGHGADGLFPGADGAAGGPALYRHRLRR